MSAIKPIIVVTHFIMVGLFVALLIATHHVARAESMNPFVSDVANSWRGAMDTRPFYPTNDTQYLPKIDYDPAIPLPQKVFGYPVGTWHLRHDQLVNYILKVAEASNRVSVTFTGETHEQRPLLLVSITNPANQSRLPQIKQHQQSVHQKGKGVVTNPPLVLYMGYSVHGNEPSGSNAVPLLLYYLAAGQSELHERLLNESVILLDPSLNPDGLSRFAHWANMHKGSTLVTDPAHREHQEDFPSGRTNHYWFDLNRDWLPLVHPESQARVEQFHQWYPHVLADFHEMGTNSTYFFQPGVPSRKNPNTPDMNVRLTQMLAEFHAEALDQQGQDYFTEERFDDFYYGKGSTYPDGLGSIGILFEQASSRGHLQESIRGVISFAESIRNQLITSMSTMMGALAKRNELLQYPLDFHRETAQLAEKDQHAGVLVRLDPVDTLRNKRFLELLSQHRIRFKTTQDKQQPAVVIALQQPAYRLIKTMFSTRERFADNRFYDVSNWNQALAYGYTPRWLSARELRRIESQVLAEQAVQPIELARDNAVAYALSWQHSIAPAVLNRLLQQDIGVNIAKRPFEATLVDGRVKAFAPGTMLVTHGLPQPKALESLLNAIQQDMDVSFDKLASGLTPAGVDLGSPAMVPAKRPELAILVGPSVSQYEVGEKWHYFDQRVQLPLTVLDTHRVSAAVLERYTHIIMVSGRYEELSKSARHDVINWVEDGGQLILQRTAIPFAIDNEWLAAEVKSGKALDELFQTTKVAYSEQSEFSAKKLIAGAVFETTIDRSHPLFWGQATETQAVFKTTNLLLDMPSNLPAVKAAYAAEPLRGGYAADELQQAIAHTASHMVVTKGRGKLILLVDNPNFRGYWYGTEKLIANAVFFSAFM